MSVKVSARNVAIGIGMIICMLFVMGCILPAALLKLKDDQDQYRTQTITETTSSKRPNFISLPDGGLFLRFSMEGKEQLAVLYVGAPHHDDDSSIVVQDLDVGSTYINRSAILFLKAILGPCGGTFPPEAVGYDRPGLASVSAPLILFQSLPPRQPPGHGLPPQPRPHLHSYEAGRLYQERGLLWFRDRQDHWYSGQHVAWALVVAWNRELARQDERFRSYQHAGENDGEAHQRLWVALECLRCLGWLPPAK